GGIAVFASFLLPLIFLYFMPVEIVWLERLKSTEFILLFVLGAIIFLLGLADDKWSLPAGVKLIVQIIAACIFAAFSAKITSLNNPLMSSLIELGRLSLPVTVLWVVGITNAFNLIDGIDGLASGSAALTALTMIWVAVTTGNYELAAVLCVLAGAVLGFLKFNFNPATIFLGDCGSLFIGFTIGAASILGTQKSATLLSLVVPLFA